MLKIKAVIFNFLILALGVNTLSLSIIHAAQTPEGCTRKLLDGTGGLKAYLSMLHEAGLIRDEAFKQFFKNLQNGKLINPITEEQASFDAVLLIHRDGLEKEYFQNTEIQIDQKELISWAMETLSQKEKDQKSQNQTEAETTDSFRRLKFQKIPKGKFNMGEKKDVPVELTHDFYMSDTHITQKQWVEIMEENPSEFKEGDQSITIQVNGKNIRLQPDHPVENVTWWSVLEFANRFSKKNGLKPVYDLSEIKFEANTKPEDGSWRPKNPTEAIEALKIIEANSNVYETEGYRLATEAEYEYVLTNLGKSQGKYIFGDSIEELKEHAWFSENSENKTHDVANKKAFMIKDLAFYDLHGNVSSWVWDRMGYLKGGINPQGPPSGSIAVIRGGSWGGLDVGLAAVALRSAFRNSVVASARWNYVGFRLVRTAQ